MEKIYYSLNMKLKPLGKRLIVKVIKTDLKYKSLILPSTSQKKTQEAKIVSVSDDLSTELKPDDRIVYDLYKGSEIEVEGERLLILNLEDIIAKLG
jgi:chaperonin GroES